MIKTKTQASAPSPNLSQGKRKPDGWREVKLGEVANVIGGGTPKTTIAEYWNGDIPWLSVADFNTGRKFVYESEKKITEEGLKNSSTKILNKRDIIISARGTVGIIAMLGKKMAFNQSCYGIKAKQNSINDFVYYLLKAIVSDLQQNAYGGVFDTITRQTFDIIPILLPPLPEQKAIAEVLSSLDDKIDLLHRQNKTLEDMAQALFRKWFIEEAKEDWEVGRLGYLLTLKSGFAFKSKDFVDCSNHKIIKIKNIKGNGIIDVIDTAFIDEEISQLEKIKFYKLEIGDIILAMSGNTTGKIGVICSDENLYLNQRVGKFFIEDKIYRNFVYLFLMSGSYEEKILNMGYGSAQPNVSPSQIHSIELSIPPRKTVELFDYQVEPLFDKIFFNQSQIRTLENLRDTLLPKLMSGAVRVRFN